MIIQYPTGKKNHGIWPHRNGLVIAEYIPFFGANEFPFQLVWLAIEKQWRKCEIHSKIKKRSMTVFCVRTQTTFAPKIDVKWILICTYYKYIYIYISWEQREREKEQQIHFFDYLTQQIYIYHSWSSHRKKIENIVQTCKISEQMHTKEAQCTLIQAYVVSTSSLPFAHVYIYNIWTVACKMEQYHYHHHHWRRRWHQFHRLVDRSVAFFAPHASF